MYSVLVHTHSILRWVVLILLLYMVLRALLALRGNSAFTKGDQKLGLAGMSVVHLQLVIGLILYFISPKVQFSAQTMGTTLLRFYTVEHILGMLIATVLITIGYRRIKTRVHDRAGFTAVCWYYGVGLLIILLSIPWPYRGVGGGWF